MSKIALSIGDDDAFVLRVPAGERPREIRIANARPRGKRMRLMFEAETDVRIDRVRIDSAVAEGTVTT